MPAYREEWERAAIESPDWQQVPSRSTTPRPAQALDELRATERALADAASVVTALTFKVASSRDTGAPPGYVHPPEPGSAPATCDPPR